MVEGVPACLLAMLCPVLMRDRPEDAAWLDHDQQTWLRGRLDAEANQTPSQKLSLLQALASPMILILILGFLLITFGVYSKNFFLPLMIKTLGYSDQMVGYLSALPNLCGVGAVHGISRGIVGLFMAGRLFQ